MPMQRRILIGRALACALGVPAALGCGRAGAAVGLPAGAAPVLAEPAAATGLAPRGGPSDRVHALLVAVSRPRALPPRLWLRGPDNDQALMRRWLADTGVPAERVLSLGRQGADAPAQHDALHQAMRTVLARLQPGDRVVLHLAGHGVQVPTPPGAPPEPDGLDEVFLLEDTARWDAAQARLPHALYDKQIGAWLDAVVDRGATVFAAFDTCHAAGTSRSAPMSGARERAVLSAELGVPGRAGSIAAGRAAGTAGGMAPTKAGLTAPGAAPAAASARAVAPMGRPAQPRLDGRLLAYAARTHEAAPEEPLPRGDRHARVHGVFTHALVDALRRGVSDAASLSQALQARYQADGRSSPTPWAHGQARLDWG